MAKRLYGDKPRKKPKTKETVKFKPLLTSEEVNENIEKIPYAFHPRELFSMALEAKMIFIVEEINTANCLNKTLQAAKENAVAVTTQKGTTQLELWKDLMKYPEMVKKKIKIRILPNENKSKMKFVHEVAEAIREVNPKADVKIVRLPGLREGENFEDWYGKYKEKKEKELVTLVMEKLSELCQ